MSAKKAMKVPERRIQNVFVLLLLAVFAGACVFMALMGARVYRDTVASSENNNGSRVLSAVVRGAVMSEDSGNAVIERFDEYGITSLTFVNDYDGEIYYRRLYLSEGYLRESFTSQERGFSPDMGDALCQALQFEPRMEGNLLTAAVTSMDGVTQEVYVYLRAGGGSK